MMTSLLRIRYAFYFSVFLPISVLAMEDEISEYEQYQELNNFCSMCLENEKTTVTLPCRHICLCESCARPINNCPLCRAKIEDKLTLKDLKLERPIVNFLKLIWTGDEWQQKVYNTPFFTTYDKRAVVGAKGWCDWDGTWHSGTMPARPTSIEAQKWLEEYAEVIEQIKAQPDNRQFRPLGMMYIIGMEIIAGIKSPYIYYPY